MFFQTFVRQIYNYVNLTRHIPKLITYFIFYTLNSDFKRHVHQGQPVRSVTTVSWYYLYHYLQFIDCK